MKKRLPVFVYYYDLLKFYTHLTTKSGAHMKYLAIKKALNKERHQYITVTEFAHYNGLPFDVVINKILE